MLKVATIVGTRPEIIRLSRIIPLLDKHCHHILIHTGQNYDYELNQIFFDDLQLRKPDYFLDSAAQSPSQTIGNILIKADEVFSKINPDAVLILGDTNSSLCAIAAKKRKIPIFHMEAGNRCFDSRVPEEINRKIVDHISDINLTYSQIAREYLLREGFPRDQVICTGSPMREVLEHYRESIENSSVLESLKISPKKYFLFSLHREENIDSQQNLGKIFDTLENLSSNFGLPIVFSTHPRTRKKIEQSQIKAASNIIFHKPFGFFDYICLQKNSRIVFSDSGTITEESSILGFPALNLRETQERPEGFEEGAVMLTGLDYQNIQLAMSILESNGNKFISPVQDYLPNNVSHKILRTIVSMTSFVNRRVWQKPS